MGKAKVIKQITILFAIIGILSFIKHKPKEVPVVGAVGTIESKLDKKSPIEKANIKGEEISKLKKIDKTYSARYGVYIEVIGIYPIYKGVEVQVKAWDKNGAPIQLPDGLVERVKIINPPIKIADGTKKNVIVDGVEGTTDNFKEDLAGALIDSLAHTITIIKK